jgi:PEP-CTERM motif
MRNPVSRLLTFSVAVLALMSYTAPARAAGGVLFYNGDPDGYDALANGVGASPVPDSLLYDQFTVAASSWTIQTAFSTDLMNYVGVTDAYWEIRTDVSAGNGGNLIASGTTAATQVDLGYSLFGFEAYTVTATGLNVQLGPGTYWLTIAPVSPPTGGVPANYSYIATTSGTNSVGYTPDLGQSYVTSAGYGLNFTPTSDPSLEGPGNWQYSMGVSGQSVPEPASSLLLGLGGLGVGGYVVFRRRREDKTRQSV